MHQSATLWRRCEAMALLASKAQQGSASLLRTIAASKDPHPCCWVIACWEVIAAQQPRARGAGPKGCKNQSEGPNRAQRTTLHGPTPTGSQCPRDARQLGKSAGEKDAHPSIAMRCSMSGSACSAGSAGGKGEGCRARGGYGAQQCKGGVAMKHVWTQPPPPAFVASQPTGRPRAARRRCRSAPSSCSAVPMLGTRPDEAGASRRQ